MHSTVKVTLALSVAIAGLVGMTALSSQAAEATLERMPAELETRFALSAIPPAMREQASVYLLDPKQGYQCHERERAA